jgi:GrpB-like predicted nucleotidyltransferase (UPF0157 family)
VGDDGSSLLYAHRCNKFKAGEIVRNERDMKASVYAEWGCALSSTVRLEVKEKSSSRQEMRVRMREWLRGGARDIQDSYKPIEVKELSTRWRTRSSQKAGSRKWGG